MNNKQEQIDPVERTMRRVVWGFIAISTVISMLYLWFDSKQQAIETDMKSATSQETAVKKNSETK